MGKQSNYKKYKDEILQLLKEGQSVSQISKRLDFNYNNLRRYLINHRYIKKGRWISPHSDKKNEVIKLFNQGCSVQYIRDKLNVSYYFIRKISENLPNPSRKIPKNIVEIEKRFNENLNKIIQDYKKDVPLKIISKKYKIGWGTVRNRLIELKVHKPKSINRKERSNLKVYEKIYKSNKVEIEKLWKEGYGVGTLRNKFNISEYYLKKKLINVEQEVTYPKTIKTLFNEKVYIQNKQSIHYDYYDLTFQQLSKKYSLSIPFLTRRLIEDGVHIVRITYSIDEIFFNKINSLKKSYWLGWMYSDGNVQQPQQINLSISRRDESIVKDFKKDLSTDKPIERFNKFLEGGLKSEYPFSRLSISNLKLYNDLLKLGVFPNKTSKIRFPNKSIVPKSLLSGFLLGYFEGDGSFSYTKRKNVKNSYRPSIDIVGTLDICEGIKKSLLDVLPLESNSLHIKKEKRSKSNVYVFSVGKVEPVLYICDYLFSSVLDSKMKRKRDKFIQFLKWLKKYPYKKMRYGSKVVEINRYKNQDKIMEIVNKYIKS